MLALKRPYSGRIITGVGIGFAEQYRVPVLLVRIFLFASILVSPSILLLYLLLSISMPDERKVASSLCEREPKAGNSPREHFEEFANALIGRVSPSSRGMPSTTIAIFLLLLAAILELPHVEGSAFYWSHPFLTSIATEIAWVAPIILYVSAALLFLFVWRSRELSVVWDIPSGERFQPSNSPAKMLGGIASGLSRILAFDAAYIRVIWIALNILTLGVAGLLYLLLWYLEKARVKEQSEPVEKPRQNSLPEQPVSSLSPRRFSILFRSSIAILLLLLGVIYIATQTRLFFFNEPSVLGIVFAVIGVMMVWRGTGAFAESDERATRSTAWLLFGTSIFLIGIYFLASAIGHIELAPIDRFEIAEIIGAIGFVYVAIVVLLSEARSIALYCALAIAVGAAMIAVHLTPPEYLAAIIRFYEFFYPTVLAALGLWITFDV